MSEKIFFLGDVDAIKTYVFEAPGLPQIRGGSQRLIECEEEVVKTVEQQGGKKIYCSGGGFLFEVPADKAENIKQAIERIYLKHTGVATVTVVYEDAPEPPPPMPQDITDGWAGRLVKAHQQVEQTNDFARRIAFLAARLREAKQQKATAPFMEAFPFGQRCGRCGKRMAAPTFREPVEDGKNLCEVCYLRDQTGRSQKGEIRGKFNQEFWERFAKSEDFQAQQPQDLDTLVESAKRTQLAFLYADGNDIGALLQQIISPGEYRQLSDALTEGTKEALFQALRDVCGPVLREEGAYWPFDIINVGGDDVIVLIQAGYAWDVAVKFLENFEHEVNRRMPDRVKEAGWVTASAGLVVADVKYPVRYMEHLATAVLKEAKRKAKAKNTSALSFLWLPTPVASEQVEPLMTIYEPDEYLSLAARPYTLDAAKVLAEQFIPTVARWPRTMRHRWAEALAQGLLTAVNFIHYDLARDKEGQKKLQLLQELTDTIEPEYRKIAVPTPIWYRDPAGAPRPKTRTALLDLLELAELYTMRPDVEEVHE